jgi:hypothetical protein
MKKDKCGHPLDNCAYIVDGKEYDSNEGEGPGIWICQLCGEKLGRRSYPSYCANISPKKWRARYAPPKS